MGVIITVEVNESSPTQYLETTLDESGSTSGIIKLGGIWTPVSGGTGASDINILSSNDSNPSADYYNYVNNIPASHTTVDYDSTEESTLSTWFDLGIIWLSDFLNIEQIYTLDYWNFYFRAKYKTVFPVPFFDYCALQMYTYIQLSGSTDYFNYTDSVSLSTSFQNFNKSVRMFGKINLNEKIGIGFRWAITQRTLFV